MPQTVNINGVGKVNFPDHFSEDQIKFAIENDILPRVKPKSQAAKDTEAFQQKIIKESAPGPLERVGRGFADVTEGLRQRALQLDELISPAAAPSRPASGSAEAFTKERTADLKLYEDRRNAAAGGDAGIDWWRLSGNVAATLPVGGVGGGGVKGGSAVLQKLLPAVRSSAAQGAAASGTMFTEEGQSAVGQTLLGGAVGGALPVVGVGLRRAGGNIIDRILPATQPAAGRVEGEISLILQQKGIDWNALTNEVKASLVADAQKALAAGGALDDVALANKATIESIGAKGTRGSVTRNPKDWQQEHDLRGVTGVGEPIAQRHKEDAAAMVNFLSGVRQKTGGKASDAYEAGESVIRAVKVQDAQKARAVDDLYTAYRESGLKGAQVPEARVMKALTNVMEEIGQDNLPAAVQARLKDFGFLGGTRTRYLTVDEADKLNRLLNANNPGHGPASKAIGMLKGGLNEALLETPGGGAGLTKAREAAAQRFAEQKAGKGIGAAVDDASPDRFVKRYIIDADARDVRGLWKELGKSAQGKQAQNDVRGHIVDTLLMKATNAKTLDDVAGSPFSYERFASALNAIPSEKLHTMFSPAEMESLRRLERASKLLTKEVPFSDVNYSKTATALANILQRVGNTPLLGQVVSPLIGVGKIGADWVEKAGQRKIVADAILGSAGKSTKKPLPSAGAERLLAGPAGAAFAQPSAGADQ